MCLIDIDQLSQLRIGRLARKRVEIDLEPLRLAGELTVIAGTLVSLRPVPMCPGFRQITVQRRDGSGSDVVIALSTLVFVHCSGSRHSL